MENNNETINTEVASSAPQQEGGKKENVWDLIKFAVIAFLIVMPIRMFIAQPFIVSGESMYPTFNDGEYLIIDEISYIVGDPSRGDVVVFRYPNSPSRFFIKRVIGLPNEKISIEGNKITITNESYPEGFVLTEPYINEDFNFSGNYETKDGEYFVLGDNRNRSSDSRIWGLLPEKLVVGRAYLRLLPIKNISYMPGAYKEAK